MKTEGKELKEAKYPYYALEVAIEFATAIKDLGGSREEVKKSVIARQVGLAESTPSFFQKLSSAKSYGIIDGWGSYRLTDLGKTYYYPTSDSDVQSAKIQMFRTPDVFSKLIKRFDGEKLPSTAILGNILHQVSGVPDSWKDRVAQMFARNAQFAGIIDAEGFLRYDASMQTKPQPEETTEQLVERYRQDPFDTPAGLIPDPAKRGVSIWSYSHKGEMIKVQTPETITKELWDKLNLYIQLLKPSEGEQ